MKKPSVKTMPQVRRSLLTRAIRMAFVGLIGLSMAEGLDTPPGHPKTPPAPAQSSGDYILGSGDQISIWALGVEEISDKPLRIDNAGDIDLPMLGRIHAAGRTTGQLADDLKTRLRADVKEPQVSVNLLDYASQPVSVIGAVNKPGVYQLQGRRSLVEMLSLAEGPRQDAGYKVRITRQLQWGKIPLPTASTDSANGYSVAEVRLQDVLQGKKPGENIAIRPHDVISVAPGQTVYVVGEVHKSGGFVLGERDRISVLQAISMAEGLDKTAAPKKAKILRAAEGSTSRKEIPVDLSQILSGKGEDIAMRPDDILVVPNNQAKSAAIRALETAVNVGTGITIWRVGLPR